MDIWMLELTYKITSLPEQPYQADLEISVSEGAHYRFEWEGNTAFSAATTENRSGFLERWKNK